jgi:hypothetical protein
MVTNKGRNFGGRAVGAGEPVASKRSGARAPSLLDQRTRRTAVEQQRRNSVVE